MATKFLKIKKFNYNVEEFKICKDGSSEFNFNPKLRKKNQINFILIDFKNKIQNHLPMKMNLKLRKKL